MAVNMTDEIEGLLRELAPPFLLFARNAQVAIDDFKQNDWARKHMKRTASLNQMAGTGRWRLVGDAIVERQSEIPDRLTLRSSDSEHNQGRYFLTDEHLPAVITVRSDPHKEGEEPEYIQTSLEGILEQAPVDFGELIKVYLSVPSAGHSTFEVATKGEAQLSYRLIDLVDEGRDSGGGEVVPFPTNPKTPKSPVVRSSIRRDRDAADEGS